MLIRLVLCISDPQLEEKIGKHLRDDDLQIECLGTQPAPWQQTMRSCGDILVVSREIIPEPVESGIIMLSELPEFPTTVILYGDQDPDSPSQLVAAGADLALSTRSSSRSLAEAIQGIVESRKQFSEKTIKSSQYRHQPNLADFFSENHSMYLFMREVQMVANSSVPLLILGETGVGKEHLARAIHAEGSRAGGPFVPVNMAAIPEQLIESELFGHAQGAFTGAGRSYRGAFEQAHHGTIFLDEIAEMPLNLQSRLLRTLQDYEVKPLGSEKAVWVDVRVIAATNRNIEEEVRLGNFRKDLYYRLSIAPLTIPPLRERREDIPNLITHFSRTRKNRYGIEVSFSDQAKRALCAYEWPGNIRELLNVLERAAILAGDAAVIDLSSLPQSFREEEDDDGSEGGSLITINPEDWEGKQLPEVIESVNREVERLYLEHLLSRTRGRIDHSAKLAGVTTRSLYAKMKSYGLRKEEYKKTGKNRTGND